MKEKFECFDCGCYYWVNDRDDFQCPNCEQNNIVRLIPIGTKVIIVDNLHEHPNYIEGSELTIKGYDEDGYYIMDSGNFCSESEIIII